ncbi:hypothetical protein [Streptomyces collinus]|nr:hypothetical protein [Streptomyces collinus]
MGDAFLELLLALYLIGWRACSGRRRTCRLGFVPVPEVPDGLIMSERFVEQERAKLAGLTGMEYGTQWRR